MNSLRLERCKHEAIKTLHANSVSLRLNGIDYRRIIPSKEFYVHQWNWDSATHAMGLVYVDEDLAFDELRSLVSGQWKNGLIPQITFNPDEKKYFPGPQFWGTEDFATGEIVTSGITQPPLLAVAVAHVYTHAKNRKKAGAFIREILPSVKKYHSYLKTFRDPEDSGLLTIVHPWESGTDNSPRFDQVLENISLDAIPESIKATVRKNRTDDKEGEITHRPRLHDYYRYMYLVSLYRSWQWDYTKIVKESPFAMKDILFSSIWCRANRELSRLCHELNDPDASLYGKWAEQTASALQLSWNADHSLFVDSDVSLGRHVSVKEDTIATFLPIYAEAVTGEQFSILLEKLNDPTAYKSDFPVPSTALSNPKFDLARYWRGPTWPITNFFLIEGLSSYKDNADALKLRNELLENTFAVIAEVGFYEYFDPLQGHSTIQDVSPSLGFGSFSWTAAIFLYLYHKYLLS